MVTALQTAERNHDIAYYGGAAQDTIEAAYRAVVAARRASETLQERAQRLLIEAQDLDATADRHWAAEAALAGRIAGAIQRDNPDLVELLLPQQRACVTCATRAQDAAFALKLERAALIAEIDAATDFRETFGAVLSAAAS